MHRNQLEYVSLDQLVPADHFVRELEASIDFDFVYPLVEGKYSPDRGRPSIDPVVLVKLTLIRYVTGLPSMEKTMEEVNLNLAYRWFLGFGFQDKIPHFSTLSKNYERRFKGTGLFEKIFQHVLKQAADQQLIDPIMNLAGSAKVQRVSDSYRTTKPAIQRKLKLTSRTSATVAS
ncbi:hypothetical protein B0X71_08580 [Planococcus lenghuensis]|uniref:Transposase InsH N-terminal domain-containing protein n=1 Tax=Planococcus lenghuensis TaxID=2213202 RepID=A0A1Q2KY50_9BACL|nr:hypothetical protein B0X71_08580 [Planococcus lenghuensis]